MKHLFYCLLLFSFTASAQTGKISLRQIDSAQKTLGWYDITNFGGKADGVTDNTAALQNAINTAIAAGGGTIYVPYATNSYKISGALQTSVNGVNPNAQIVIPLVQKSANMVYLRILGGTPPNMSAEGIESLARTAQGVILESTIQGTGTTPAVFGTPWYNAGVSGNRNFIHVHFENLIVRTATKSGSTHIAGTMSGINFTRLIQFTYDKLKVDVSSALYDMVQPTNETYGIMMPDVNNKVELGGGVVMTEGYKYGYLTGEHDNIKHFIALGCQYAFVIPFGAHTVSIQHLTVEASMNVILVRGTMNVNIFNYECEHYHGNDKWYKYVKDIDWTGGSGRIAIFTANVVQSFVGTVNEFIVHPSVNYRVFNGAGENVAYVGSNGYQVETNAYISAVTSAGYAMTETEKIKADSLVIRLKEAGLWAKIYQLLPFMGTAASRVINMKNPGAHNITFTGGWTHNTAGSTGDGTTSHINTNFNPSLHFTAGVNSFGITASLGGSPTGTAQAPFGGYDNSGREIQLIFNFDGTNSYSAYNSASQGWSNPASYDGTWTLTRTASNSAKTYRNGAVIHTSTSTPTSTFTNFNLYMAARNGNGNTVERRNTQTFKITAMHAGLSDSEALELHNIFTLYNQGMGR